MSEKIVSKPATNAYRDNWDLIFGSKELPKDIYYTMSLTPLTSEEATEKKSNE